MSDRDHEPGEDPTRDAPEVDPGALLAASLEGARGPGIDEMAEHFPQFELLEVLGQGGMGIVYRARQKSLDREVALKVLAPPPGDASAFAERFGREARALAKLEHPNIVRVYDYGSSDDLHYLVMELVDGVTLRDAMRDGAMTSAQALGIVPRICDALQAAHDEGVVHRDIKPENVLIAKDGAVKIADFGLAKIVEGDASKADTRLTRRDQVMGTLHYMAPEQFESPGDVDHRADLYSLGVVLYEMLTGELPIGRFDLPSERVTVDVRLDQVVVRALAKQRDRRYQAATEFRSDMDVVAAGGDLPDAPVPAARREAEKQRARDPDAPKHHERKPGSPYEPAPPRRSLLAMCAFAAVPLGLTSLMISGVIAMAIADDISVNDHYRTWWVGGVAAIVCAIAGTIGGIAAWIRIKGSDGRLTGLRLAVGATVLPFLLAPVVIPTTVMLSQAMSPQSHVPPGRRGRRSAELIRNGPSHLTPGHKMVISDFIQAVVAAGTSPTRSPPDPVSLNGLDAFYDEQSMTSLRALTPEVRVARARAGELGFPLLMTDTTRISLQEYESIASIALAPDARSATVTLRARDGSTLKFLVAEDPASAQRSEGSKPIVLPPNTWRFVAADVYEKLTTRREMLIDDVVVRNAGNHRSDTTTAIVEELRALAARGISHAIGDVGSTGLDSLYEPDDITTVKGLAAEELTRMRKHSRLGLALVQADAVPEPLHTYGPVTVIEFSDDRERATVQMNGKTSALRFECVVWTDVDDVYMVDNGWGPREVARRHWRLAALPVEVVELPPTSGRRFSGVRPSTGEGDGRASGEPPPGWRQPKDDE